MIKEYCFVGYSAFDALRDEMQALLFAADRDEDWRFYLALSEAVCNAAMYSIDGPEKVRIAIRIRVEPTSISAMVQAKTKKFDARSYKEHLMALAMDPKVSLMDWGEYTHDHISGRGFWYMLNGADAVFIEEEGQFVVLHLSLPLSDEHKMQRLVCQLVPRLFVTESVISV